MNTIMSIPCANGVKNLVATYPSSQPPLSAMSLSTLADRCMSEINNYRHGIAYNDQYCLEILRRAILQRNPYAWELLQQHLSDIVLGWLRRHSSRETVCRFDSEENYVAQAFERFWHAAVHHRQLEFQTLAAALRYLRACLNGVLLDTLRTYLRPKEIPLPEPDSPGEPFAEDYDDSHEVWEIIRSMLPNPLEQRLAYLLFHCGLKPKEILRVCPQEFDNVREIYHRQRNILSRLRRNADQIRWRLDSQEGII